MSSMGAVLHEVRPYKLTFPIVQIEYFATELQFLFLTFAPKIKEKT